MLWYPRLTAGNFRPLVHHAHPQAHQQTWHTGADTPNQIAQQGRFPGSRGRKQEGILQSTGYQQIRQQRNGYPWHRPAKPEINSADLLQRTHLTIFHHRPPD